MQLADENELQHKEVLDLIEASLNRLNKRRERLKEESKGRKH